MKKHAIIYDLDNTIYAVSTIGEVLFAPLFQLIKESGFSDDAMQPIREDIMRKPFQVVAAQYQFSEALTTKGIQHLKELTYTGKIEPYPDYQEIKSIRADRFLVTTGFEKLQTSKIQGMQIENDFLEIHIVDPLTSSKTKRIVFEEIMKKHQYAPTEVLVVGDDPASEIKAATELGIDTVLLDKSGLHATTGATYKITSFQELVDLMQSEP